MLHKRVLVVEDDASTRQMLAVALGDPELEVLPAMDGAHALRSALARRPDVVVLDLGLPVLDGSGFVAQWRERSPTARDVPIIVISGLPYGQEMSDELDVAAFFRKPFDVDLLLSTVKAVAARTHA